MTDGPHTDAQSAIRGLLGFLDRRFTRFHPVVQNTIGIGFLFVVVAYMLHGFIAPTYMRGRVWIRDASGKKSYASRYQLEINDKIVPLSRFGSWEGSNGSYLTVELHAARDTR